MRPYLFKLMDRIMTLLHELILEPFLDKSSQHKNVFHLYASATTCEHSMERSIEYSIELTCVVRFRMLAHLI